MKWVKTAIGAVIAISVIPMIVLSVFNLTQEKVREEVVSFTLNVIAKTYTPTNVYDDIMLYGNIDEDGYFDNIIEIKYNNIETTDLLISFNRVDKINIIDITVDDLDLIGKNGNYIIAGGIFSDNDTLEITFEVTTPPVVSGVTATLLTLSIIVFASAILFSFYNIRKEGDF